MRGVRAAREDGRIDGLLKRLGRFAGVGAVATLAHVSVAIVAAGVVADPRLANVAGFAAAFLVSYLGHFHLTFRLGAVAEARHEVHVVRFLVVSLLGLGLSTGLVDWLTIGRGLSFTLTMGVVAIVVAAANFAMSSIWAFRTSQGRGVSAPDRSGLAGTIIAGSLAALFLMLHLGHPINHDTAWYLVATRTWLEGGTLYVDVVEINPPLAFYLTVPSIVLSDLTGLDETTAFHLVLAALILAVTRWIWGMIGTAGFLSPIRHAGLTAAIGFSLFLPALSNVGQREQIMTILVAPWVVGWFLHPGGGTGRAAILRAGVAAIGLCLKPHFVVIPAALTLAEMVRTRSVRPCISLSNVTMVLFGAAYVAFVALVHPVYLQSIVPIGLLVYDVYEFGPRAKVLNAHPLTVVLFALMVAAAWRSGGRGIQVAAALLAGGLGSYLAQNKGFSYHALPVLTFAVIGAAWVLADSRTSRPGKVLAVWVMALALQVGLRDGRYSSPITNALLPPVQDLLAQAGPGHSIMALSTGLIAFPLVLEARTGWASRYPALWFVPGALNGLDRTDCTAEPERCAALRSILAQSLENTVADIATARPDLIIVDRWHRHTPVIEIDHLGLLLRTDGGPGALAPYREVLELGAFRILQRQAE